MPKLKKKIDQLKNFGFVNEVTVVEAGINAKMNELQSAFGLLQLKRVEEDIRKRQAVYYYYMKNLADIPGIRLLEDMPDVKHNYSYFPIFIEEDYPLSRDGLYEKLKESQIFGRRYFYPLISDFPMYSSLPSANPDNLKNGKKLAEQVLCLPIYSELEFENQKRAINIISSI